MSSEIRHSTRIPEFSSIQEAAEFWDTHSQADFKDEFDEVTMRVSPDMGSLFEVRAPMELAAGWRLMALARQRGVPVADLAAVWITAGMELAEADAASDESRPDAETGTRG